MRPQYTFSVFVAAIFIDKKQICLAWNFPTDPKTQLLCCLVLQIFTAHV
jgi:hypothetical protein